MRAIDSNKLRTRGREAASQIQRGSAAVKALFLALAVLVMIPLLIVGFYEGRKAYWDRQVRELCAKDGGIKVFETVVITPKQLQVWGGAGGVLGVPNETDKNNNIPFFRRTKDIAVHAGSPNVMRLETEFIRRSDGKLLGRFIYYFRRGGDFPSWAHESSVGCKAEPLPIEAMIFILRGE